MVLDYIQDMNDNYWIVSYQHNGIKYGYPVYIAGGNGERIHPESGLTYKKSFEILREIPETYKNVFHPKECFEMNKNHLPGIWMKLIEAVHMIGIEDKDLGIFGSTICGFPIKKDVDFIIYGKENLKKYYENQMFVKAYMDADYISVEHTEYQYSKYKELYSPKMDLKKILSNNWSGIQLKNGILSTPRFISEKYMDIPKIDGENEIMYGTVMNSLNSSCTPRYFNLSIDSNDYTVITPFWMLQSCVRDGDHIEIYGNTDHVKKIILMIDKTHYMKFF